MSLPPQTSQFHVRPNTSLLGIPTGRLSHKHGNHMSSMKQQLRKWRKRSSSSSKQPAGLYFDRNKNHKDLATCHRIYRPLSPRPTSAARKIFGPNATQKKKHPMGRFQTGQRPNQKRIDNNNNNNNNIDPTQAIFLDAGSSVSSDSGWVTRYPATYRAITIKPGEMPIVQPQTVSSMDEIM